MATDLYKTIKITPKRQSKPPVSQKAYRGFSTVNPDNNSFQQFDVSLIKQNLFFALIYNSIGVPVAAGILFPFFGILLSPMIAALAMSFSSVSVISNALRLRQINIDC